MSSTCPLRPPVRPPAAERPSRAFRLACLVASIGLGGCLVGPKYAPPRVDLPDAWSDLKSPTAAPPAASARWWDSFDDPTLSSLVERAVAQNLTLRQAGLRVLEARALRGIAAGQFFPQTQDAVGAASANRISRNSPQGALRDRSYQEYSLGLEAAWELDFWGRFRRGIESADASLEATVADYDAALVLVAADVASNYVAIRSIQEQLGFTRANLASQQDTLDLSRVRFDAGAVSELDVATAQATLANTRSLVPELEDALRQAKLALCVLLGRTPSDLETELGEARPVPTAPAGIALGLPADLLRRRPDVRRAERAAAALCAQIGVATSDLYPALTLGGATGFRTSTSETVALTPYAHNLLDTDSFEGFIGLDFRWPILNYGRIRNNIRAADARFEQAAVAYQNAVLQAAAEVESGLSTLLRGRERAAFLAESVAAAQRTVELSLIQYRFGAVDFLRVNQAQVDLVERQNSLVRARAIAVRGAIDTYRALGGGWEVRAGREFVPRETIDRLRARTSWGDLLAPDYEQGTDLLLFPRPRERGAPPEPEHENQD